MVLALFLGVLGYLMRRFGFPLAPAVLALVLGFIVETNYRRALTISGGDHMIFVANPISLFLILLALASFLIPVIRVKWMRKKEASG